MTAKEWLGLVVLVEPPSPKVQLYVKVPGPVELFVKLTVAGARHTDGSLKVKDGVTP